MFLGFTRKIWKIAKSSGSPDKWSNYKKLNNEVKDKLRKAYYRYDVCDEKYARPRWESNLRPLEY